MVYFGDGASSHGDCQEAMNFAGVFQAPLVFFCLNNQWAISLPRARQTPRADARAEGDRLRLPGDPGGRQRRPRQLRGHARGRRAGAAGRRADADRGPDVPAVAPHHGGRSDEVPRRGRGEGLGGAGAVAPVPPVSRGQGHSRRRAARPRWRPRSTPRSARRSSGPRRGCRRTSSMGSSMSTRSRRTSFVGSARSSSARSRRRARRRTGSGRRARRHRGHLSPGCRRVARAEPVAGDAGLGRALPVPEPRPAGLRRRHQQAAHRGLSRARRHPGGLRHGAGDGHAVPASSAWTRWSSASATPR